MLCVTPSCVTDRKIKVYLPKIIFIFSISISYIGKKVTKSIKKNYTFPFIFFSHIVKKINEIVFSFQ